MSAARVLLFVVPLFACGEAAESTPPASANERSGATASTSPNIVLVSIDSLRADHLGCYGYQRETSPFLDELAAEGMRFERAISTTSWTLPAHAAMFTGLYDSTHGLVDNGQRLADAHGTIAEVLAERGYHTAGFFGGPYLHPTFGLAQGFEVYESCMTTTEGGASDEAVRREARAEESRSHVDVTGPRTREAVASWVVGERREPFFLFLHLWDVHYDYLPPPEYVELFDPGYDGPVDGRDVMGDDSIAADMPERDREHLVALYDAEIRFTDRVLREIFATLRSSGLMENTVVIVTADHGEEFFEHGGKGHQRTLYDEVLRVPLIVCGPGVEPGVVKEQVRLVDLFATIAALAGVDDVPLVTQGRDLGPFLRGETLEPAEALAELLVNDRRLRALRTDAFKLVVDEKTRQSEFFQLRNDPGEHMGLGSIEMVVAPNRERIRALLNETVEKGTRLRRFLGSRAPGEADAPEDVQELLRSLGYVDSGDRRGDEDE